VYVPWGPGPVGVGGHCGPVGVGCHCGPVGVRGICGPVRIRGLSGRILLEGEHLAENYIVWPKVYFGGVSLGVLTASFVGWIVVTSVSIFSRASLRIGRFCLTAWKKVIGFLLYRGTGVCMYVAAMGLLYMYLDKVVV